jgi:hypothetical protein
MFTASAMFCDNGLGTTIPESGAAVVGDSNERRIVPSDWWLSLSRPALFTHRTPALSVCMPLHRLPILIGCGICNWCCCCGSRLHPYGVSSVSLACAR